MIDLEQLTQAINALPETAHVSWCDVHLDHDLGRTPPCSCHYSEKLYHVHEVLTKGDAMNQKILPTADRARQLSIDNDIRNSENVLLLQKVTDMINDAIDDGLRIVYFDCNENRALSNHLKSLGYMVYYREVEDESNESCYEISW